MANKEKVLADLKAWGVDAQLYEGLGWNDLLAFHSDMRDQQEQLAEEAAEDEAAAAEEAEPEVESDAADEAEVVEQFDEDEAADDVDDHSDDDDDLLQAPEEDDDDLVEMRASIGCEFSAHDDVELNGRRYSRDDVVKLKAGDTLYAAPDTAVYLEQHRVAKRV